MQYNIINFDTLSSTNDKASDTEFNHADVIVANSQTAGRGQRGNKWNATKGLNLTFSLVICPKDITIFQQFRISEMAAMAACEALNQYNIKCKVKWPNDLYIDNKKIGGILIEHTSMGPEITKSIIGIGINVNQNIFPPNIPNPTSLKILGIETTPQIMLQKFLDCFSNRLTQPSQDLHNQYLQHLWPGTGRFKDNQGEFQAHIDSIDPNSGMITLIDQKNQKSQYYFKEVEFIL